MSSQDVVRALGQRQARMLGAALAAYGAAGIVLLVAAAFAITPSLTTISALARSSADVRSTLASTRDAFDGFGASLVKARQSTERAAASARSSAAAARQLEGAMSLSFLGVQPLRSLAAGFQQQGQDLEALAGELDDLAEALGTNEGDVRDIRDNVAALHERTSALASAPLVAGADWVGPLTFGLIAWLLAQAVAAAWAGAALLRAARGSSGRLPRSPR